MSRSFLKFNKTKDMKTENIKIFLLGIILVFSMLVNGCKKTERSEINDVQTILLDVKINSVVFRTTILFIGSVSDMGICWSTETAPTVDDNKISIGEKTNPMEIEYFFESNIIEFNHNTKYYVRAYARNNEGTVYGNTETFKVGVGPGENIIDIDGNTYTTVNIGTQIWMSENLKVTHLTNSNNIYFVGDDPDEWVSNGNIPNYGYYNNDINNSAIYGHLYNQRSIERDEICPSGWHLPTINDWKTLESFLYGSRVAGGKIKEAGTTHWQNPNSGATNESGFNALPAGTRNNGGYFDELGFHTYWWSKSPFGYYCKTFVTYSNSLMYISEDRITYNYGYSVRCIKNLDKK